MLGIFFLGTSKSLHFSHESVSHRHTNPLFSTALSPIIFEPSAINILVFNHCAQN